MTSQSIDQNAGPKKKKWVPPHLRPGYKESPDLQGHLPPPAPIKKTMKSPNFNGSNNGDNGHNNDNGDYTRGNNNYHRGGGGGGRGGGNAPNMVNSPGLKNGDLANWDDYDPSHLSLSANHSPHSIPAAAPFQPHPHGQAPPPPGPLAQQPAVGGQGQRVIVTRSERNDDWRHHDGFDASTTTKARMGQQYRERDGRGATRGRRGRGDSHYSRSQQHGHYQYEDEHESYHESYHDDGDNNNNAPRAQYARRGARGGVNASRGAPRGGPRGGSRSGQHEAHGQGHGQGRGPPMPHGKQDDGHEESGAVQHPHHRRRRRNRGKQTQDKNEKNNENEENGNENENENENESGNQENGQKNENRTIMDTLNDMGKNKSQSHSKTNSNANSPNKQRNNNDYHNNNNNNNRRNQHNQHNTRGNYNSNRNNNNNPNTNSPHKNANNGNNNNKRKNNRQSGNNDKANEESGVTLNITSKSTAPTKPGGWAANLGAKSQQDVKRGNARGGPMTQAQAQVPQQAPAPYMGHGSPMANQQQPQQQQPPQQPQQPQGGRNGKNAKYQQSSLPPNLQRGGRSGGAGGNRGSHYDNKNEENPFVSDSEKVNHVLEVTNVNSNNLEAQKQISAMLTRNQISYENVIGAKGRTFITFDRPKTAMLALTNCQNEGFNLRRVADNPDTVAFLLKNVVIPAPPRPRTDARVAQRMINAHLGGNNNNNNNNNHYSHNNSNSNRGRGGHRGNSQNSENNSNSNSKDSSYHGSYKERRVASGASQRDRVWRETESAKIKQERQRKQDLANDRNSSWQ